MTVRRACLVALWAGILAAWCGAQPIDGQIETLGFPAASPTGLVIRPGQWFPIRVQLAAQGTGTFTRELRFEALDLDGDRVAYVHPQVTVSGEGGAKQRKVWCYAVVNSVTDLPAALDVLDERGATVAKLPLPPCDVIGNDELVILDISAEPVAALNRLGSAGLGSGRSGDSIRDTYRPVVISRIPASTIPDRWWGLEAADVIVWDRPNPSDLSVGQLDALLEWVRAGGQLIIGVGSTWDAIRGSALAEVMPLQGEGTRDELLQLPVFASRFGVESARDRQLESPVLVTTAALAPGALRTLAESGPTGVINLITMRPVGAGRVTATAAGLRNLTNAVRVSDEFYPALLEMNQYTKKFRDAQLNVMSAAMMDLPLYDWYTEPISFATATAVRGLLAFLFVGAYIVVATLVSWWWLRLRRATHYSWAVFAGIAVTASVLSLVTVRATSGFSAGVQTLNIIDLEAGQKEARGACLFGYRSGVGRRADIALAGEGTYLRPLARGRVTSFYVTPMRYDAVAAKARMTAVPVRATLKQAEGYWHGEVDDGVRGDLLVDRGTGRFTPGSWLVNKLPVDLDGAVLIYTDPRLDEAGVPRPAGVTAPYVGLPMNIDAETRAVVAAKMKRDLPEIPPARNILVLGTGAMKSGQRVDNLGAEQNKQVDDEWQRWAGTREPKRSEMPDLPNLWREQLNWRATFASALPRAVQAVLLASTRDYHLHSTVSDINAPDVPLTTDGMPRLDISHWLVSGKDAEGQDAGYAILIAWTGGNTPGPATLLLDGRPEKAYKGRTIYRVRIPIRYTGSPPAREGA